MAWVLCTCPKMAWSLVWGIGVEPSLGMDSLMRQVEEGGGEACRWSRGGIRVRKKPERWAEVLMGHLKGLVFFPRAVEGN